MEFSGTALKYLLRPFSTLHILVSCPVELFSLIITSPDILVQIRFSHFCLKWYWILISVQNILWLWEMWVHLVMGQFCSFYVRILEILSDELVHSSRCKNRPNGPCNINPLQSLYLAAACIVKMILMVVWRQRAFFFLSILPVKDTYLYQTFIFRYYKHTVHNWWNWYLLEIYGREWTAFNNWSPRLSLYLKRQIIIWQDSTVAIMKRKRSWFLRCTH